MRRLVPFVCVIFVLEAALYSALAPLLPHLSHALGPSRATAGILTGSYAAGVIPGAAAAVRLSSGAGVRATLVAGLLVLGAATLAFGLGTSAAVLIGTRALQGVAAGAVWSAALDWLTSAAPRGGHGRLLGTTFGAATFGMIGGPVLGSMSLAIGRGAVFGAVGVCALGLAAWPLLLDGPRAPGAQASLLGPYADRATAPKIGLVALQALPVGLLSVLVPLRLSGLGAPQAVIAGTFLLAAAVGSAVSQLAGRIGDRRGHALPIRIGLLAALPCLLALPLPRSTVAIGVLTVVFLGVCRSTSLVPSVALLTAESVRDGATSAVPAAILTAGAVGETIGSAGGAGLAQATSDVVSYVAVASLYLVALVAVSRALPTRARHPPG